MFRKAEKSFDVRGPVFFTRSPSFLAHQRMLEKTSGRSNCLTLTGMDGIPTDNHIRNILEPAPPEHLDDVLINMVRDLEARGVLHSLHRIESDNQGDECREIGAGVAGASPAGRKG